LALGANSQPVYLTPSLLQKDTTVFSPETCTPAGKSEPNGECLKYRGQAFDSSKSTSFVAAGRNSEWKQNHYSLFANGAYGNDKIWLSKSKNLEKFEFVLADACNMTSGMLGLGKDSTFLNRLKGEKMIASRSYGLHVGVDIMN